MTFQPCGTVVTVSLDHETSQEEESFGSGCGATRQQSHERSICVRLKRTNDGPKVGDFPHQTKRTHNATTVSKAWLAVVAVSQN
jgi:hypothetical protein